MDELLESSERDFEASVEEILATVEEAGRNAMVPLAVFKVTGLASFALLEKIHAVRIRQAMDTTGKTTNIYNPTECLHPPQPLMTRDGRTADVLV